MKNDAQKEIEYLQEINQALAAFNSKVLEQLRDSLDELTKRMKQVEELLDK